MKRLMSNALLRMGFFMGSSAALFTASFAHAQVPIAPTAASASAPVTFPTSPEKKELVQKILALQQPGIEGMARSMVEQPALRMLQDAGRVLQQQVPADKRDAVGKGIEADVKKFVDESTPIVRDHAIKLAPSTIGTLLEERFTEDELKQLLAWLNSPVNKKYGQLGPEMQSVFTQKLIAEVRPLIDPRLQALEAKVRANLGIPASGAAASGAAASAAAKPAARATPKKDASK